MLVPRQVDRAEQVRCYVRVVDMMFVPSSARRHSWRKFRLRLLGRFVAVFTFVIEAVVFFLLRQKDEDDSAFSFVAGVAFF